MPLLRLCATWIVVVLVMLSISACSSKKRARSSYDSTRFISEHDLRALPTSDIPIVINDRVVAWIEYFHGPGRRHFVRYLERSARYLPLMKAILQEQGMPTDLVYIALIESGFNNHAYSRAAAVGPWQFIRSTGKIYGLEVNEWVDERRDPVRATYAAARMFRDLYQDYGDWYLAMVGYNAGPGRVAKAMEITGSRDFWVMAEDRTALKPETRDYVPKFIAAMIMARQPEKFGFRNLNFHEPWEHESAAVETQTDISVIAKCAGVAEHEVLDLNPHLIRGATPPNHNNYKVRLPKGTSQKFLLAYANVPKEERIQIVRHNVRHGDTMYKIAKRYGISVQALAQANGLSRKSKLHRGKTLVIPVGASAARFAKAYDEPSSEGQHSKLIRYNVKKGDTLGAIAAKFPGVTVSKLKSWNHLGRHSHIRTGQKLKIYTKAAYASSSISEKPESHTVKHGETLGGIAARYGTTAKKLMALNSINNPKHLRSGMKLKVQSSGNTTTAIALEDAKAPTGSGVTKIAKVESETTSTHRVRKGETLGTIAAKYGVSTKQLMSWNGIKNPKYVRAGQNLKVRSNTKTTSSTETTAIALDDTSSGSTTSTNASGHTHHVRKGETLGTIAAKYGVSTKQLMSWNDIKNPRMVKAGQKLVIKKSTKSKVDIESAPSIKPVPNNTPIKISVPNTTVQNKTITHRVSAGETLWDIARKHSVTIAQLQKWNNLNDPSSVRLGTTLKIFKN
ncbi:MAG: LysM peptidoglycan-binding domain-containing protein [Pseudomonadota bacterium]